MPAPRPITIRQQIQQIQRRKGKPQSQAQTIAGLLGAPAKGVSQVGTSAPLAPAPTGAAPLAPKSTSRIKNDWGDGRRHSISLAQHNANVKAKRNDKNALYDPTTQLSGDALRSAAGDLVNLEYGPQRAALARELQNTTTQGTALAGRAADYSKQLAANDANLPTQIGAIGQLLGDKLTANTAASQTGIDAALAATKGRAAADADVTGVNLGLATAPAAAEAQAQSGRLAELGKASQDNAAATTANYQGLAAISGAARAQMGNEVQGELLNRLASQQADVRGRQADEAAQEGPALTKNVNDLRQQGFENLITQAGLNVKTADLKEQTSHDQAQIAEAGKVRRQRARDARATRAAKAKADKAARDEKATDVNEFGIANGDWKGMTNAQRQKAISDFNKQKTKDTTRPGAAKPGDKETALAISTKTGIDNALADIKTDAKLQRHVGEPGPRLTQILTNRGASPVVAQAAAEIAKHGQLSATSIAALKRAGIKIPAEWLPHPVAGVDPPLPGVFG